MNDKEKGGVFGGKAVLFGSQMARCDDIWPAVKVDSRHASIVTSQ